MYSNQIRKFSQRFKELVHKLENTDYNPDELEAEFMELEKNLTKLEGKIEKEIENNNESE